MTARSLNYDEIDIITRLQFHLINRISFNTHALLSGGERARILRSFLIALVGSPWLLFIGPARQIISLEVTLAAIVLGVIFGIVTAIGLADVDI